MSRPAGELLRIAADALEDGRDPLSTAELAEQGVTLDECFRMGDALAAGARLLAWALDHPQTARAAIDGARLETVSEALAHWQRS